MADRSDIDALIARARRLPDQSPPGDTDVEAGLFQSSEGTLPARGPAPGRGVFGAEGPLARGFDALGRGVADAPRYGGELLGDFFRSLVPSIGARSKEEDPQLQASQRLMGKVGDISMALGGGRVSMEGGGAPEGRPMGGPGRMLTPVPSLNIPQALERAQALQTPLPRPLTRPPLALPPPTVGTPGAPPITTGPGRPALPGVTPPPGTGMIPPRQVGTMTTPEATPRAGAVPPEALFPAQAGRGEPSILAGALAANDATPIDRVLVNRYRQLTQPGMLRGRRANIEGLTAQDQQIQTAVDSIIGDIKSENGAIRLTDSGGFPVKQGFMPRTLRQFAQAIDQLRDRIFQQYNQLAERITGQGVRVPLQPAINKLEELINEPGKIRDDPNSPLAQQARNQIATWRQVGSYTPIEMQNHMKYQYEKLEGIFQAGGGEATSYQKMMSQVISVMKQTLDNTMATALGGPEYQALRNRYGAVASIEANVANAVRKQMAQKPAPTGLNQAIELATDFGVLHGLVHFSPETVAAAASTKALKHYYNYLNSPNRAVTRMFQQRAQALDPLTSERLSAQMAVRLGEMRDQRYNAIRRGALGETGLTPLF